MWNLLLTVPVSLFVLFLVLPIAPQQAKQAQTTQNATEDEARLVFAFGEVEVNAIAKDGQIHDYAEDIAHHTRGLVLFFKQKVIEQKRDDDQRGIDQVIGCFFGNHDFSI